MSKYQHKLVPHTTNGVLDWYYFWCPGCKHVHRYDVPRWTFNGSMELPTFQPSLLSYYKDPETNERVTCCHLYLTNGQIQFLSDCPHDLKGQTVPMEFIPDDYGLSTGN